MLDAVTVACRAWSATKAVMYSRSDVLRFFNFRAWSMYDVLVVVTVVLVDRVVATVVLTVLSENKN